MGREGNGNRNGKRKGKRKGQDKGKGREWEREREREMRIFLSGSRDYSSTEDDRDSPRGGEALESEIVFFPLPLPSP